VGVNLKSVENTRGHWQHIHRFIIVCCIAVFAVTATVNARLIRPDNGPEPEKLVISGHSRNYYKLEKSNPLIFNLNGPQRIRVITRVVIPEDDTTQQYRVEYHIDSQTPRQFKAETEVSPVTQHSEFRDVQFGRSKSFYLTIPEGSHTYRFYPANGSDKIMYLRVIAAKMEQKQDNQPEMVQLRPEGNAEKTVLQYKDVSLTYYAITNEHTAEVSVNGPSTLQVYSRLQFEYWMEGEVTYRVQVLEDGQINGTYQLSSERSETTIYRDDGELVPGKWRRFEIEVPKGRHTFEFQMPDSEYSALIKVQLQEDGAGAE